MKLRIFLCAGSILESKGMHAIFQKKGQKNVKWVKMYKIWKYFEKGQVIVCDKLLEKAQMWYNLLVKSISTSNLMFGRAIWDKLPKCMFENFEIARVKQGQFQNFQKSWGWFIQKLAWAKHD